MSRMHEKIQNKKSWKSKVFKKYTSGNVKRTVTASRRISTTGLQSNLITFEVFPYMEERFLLG